MLLATPPLTQLHQNRPVMDDFSLNAVAFNCGLIAFEKLDMGQTWQQQDHSRRQVFVNKPSEDRILIRILNLKRPWC